MSLRQLAAVIPGYVTMCVHTKDEGWELSAALLSSDKDFPEADVITATPIGAYRMEISIKFREVKV